MSVKRTPWQRLLSLLLCAAMVLSFVPTAWATEAEITEAEDSLVVETAEPDILGETQEEAEAVPAEPLDEINDSSDPSEPVDSAQTNGGIMPMAEETVTAASVIAMINALPTVDTVDSALRGLRPADVNSTEQVNAHLTQLTDYKDAADAAERAYYALADADRANVTNFDVLVALKARLAQEVLPKAGDITTVTVAESNIDFNLYNYSRDINKTADGNWRKLASYFIFQNKNYGIPSYDGLKVAGGSIDSDMYAYNLGTDGYPVLSTDFILEADREAYASETSRSLSHLFGGEDYEDGYPGSVAAYEDVINTPLTYDSDTGYYTYKSVENAVDFSITENKVYVRNYLETGYDAANASFNYRGDDHISDFFPFNTVGTAKKTLERANGFDSTLTQSYDYHYRTAFETDEEKFEYADYWFGATMAAEFYMPKNGQVGKNNNDMIFEFSGDDDVLVYIDNILLMDLGGAHPRWDGNINFVNGLIETYVNCNGANGKTGEANKEGTVGDYESTTIYENFKAAYEEQGMTDAEVEAKLAEVFVRVGDEMVADAKGNSYPVYRFKNYTHHTFNWFYLERYAGASNFNVKFNLPMIPEKSLTVQKDVETDGNAEEDAFIKDTVEYKFRVLKANADGTASNELFVGPFKSYDIYEESVKIGSGTTDENGYFTLKAGQQAIFAGMLAMLEGETKYVVEELIPEELAGQYGKVEYEYKGTTGTTNKDDHADEKETFDTFYTGVMDAEDSSTVVFVNRIDTTKLGVLNITKKAHAESNIGTEKVFRVQVTLGGKLLEAGTEYTVGGASKIVAEAGIIELTVGQTARIEGIVSGTVFEVTEVLGDEESNNYNVTYTGTMTSGEAGAQFDQPVVTGTGVTGEFPLNGEATVTITNQNVDFGIQLPITKTATGNTGDASFAFNVELVEQVGGEWVVKEAVAGATVTLDNTATGSTVATIGYKSNTAVGSYYYKVSEQTGSDSYIYDTTFYIVEIQVQENSVANITNIWKNGDQENGKVASITFVNQKTTSIQVKKVVYGIESEDKTATYTVDVSWDGGSETVTLKNNETKQVNGIPVGATVTVTENASGFEVYVKAGDGNYNKASTATITALENTVALVTFANVGQFARPDTVVIDYGLPVDVLVLGNDIHAADTTITLKEDDGVYGKASLVEEDTAIRYEVKDMNMKDADVFEYAYVYTPAPEIGDVNVTSELTIIPATTIYYEDSFVDLKVYKVGAGEDGGNALTNERNWVAVEDENKNADAVQDEDRPGESLGGLDADNVYGYDGAYTKMSKYSLGSAQKVTVDEKFCATAEFTFTGTGFDVISLTSSDTGTIMVSVKEKDAEKYNDHYMVDTYYGYKYVTGEDGEGSWVVDPQENNALYQVPVMKIEDLPYGTYDVMISVSYSKFMDNRGNGAYDFYLDAIRIYDPANDGAGNEVIEDAYVQDHEGWPSYQELRNLVIAANDFNALDEGEQTEGIIFIDDTNNTNKYEIQDYISYGPNNELYLAPGQSISFKMTADANVDKVHLALKTVGGNAQVEVYGMVGETRTQALSETISTATDLYYDITGIKDQVVVIQNTSAEGGAILSITNIKTTHTSKPDEASGVSITVDHETAKLALASLEAAAAPVEPVNPFTDVAEDAFYYEPVQWAVANGITNGMTETLFGPNVVCNRAQVVTFLWRAAGCPEPMQVKSPFVDVELDSFYYKAVLWAVENGITNGTDATHFSPNAECNRAAVVTFLHRACGSPEPVSTENPFADVQEQDFFYKAVLWAVENEITNGVGGNAFAPVGICNRGQVVTFLYRANN